MLVRTESKGELAVSAMAAKAKAMVEARYVMAQHNKRNIEQSRRDILDACARPSFARGARYKKPVGGGQTVDGFSIRFAETAIQCMGNISVETTTVYEDDDKRTVHIAVVDLEKIIDYGKDVTIAKTVERRNLKPGQNAISERVNSNGQKVYLVHATEDEIANKIAAAESKIIRNCGLRMVRQDILEEAEEAIAKSLEKGGDDPKSEARKVYDAFASLGVKPAELERYLGHPLDSISPKEVNDLRAIYATVRDGEASWADYMAQAEPKRPAQTIPVDPAENAKQAKAAASTIETADPRLVDKPFEVVLEYAHRDGVPEPQVVKYCKGLKLCGEKVEELAQMRGQVLRDLAANWATILPAIKKA